MRSLVLLLVAVLASPAAAANQCCALCLGFLGPSTYDVTDFASCQGKTPGCCFLCEQDTTISSPSFQSTMTTGTPQIVKWSDSNLANVTKVELLGTAATQAHPRPQPKGTPVSKDAKGNYVFCLDSPGTILFRGFGAKPTDGSCQKISSEMTITVSAGPAGASCSKSTSAPSAGSGSAAGSAAGSGGNSTKPKKPTCDPNRGFVNSENVCECLSDYSGPPTCDGMATWKLLVSIAGGLAALFSIAVSIRQFMLFRKRKEEERQLATQNNRASKDEVEVMAISLEPNYYDAKRTPNSQKTGAPNPSAPMKPYPVDSHHNMSPRQSREYTL
ncbi:hypothetical protein ACHHYP_10939 [Achlya hypogyna]|uniref:Secreted protein n=1 Tax=Achlya hypogyna TaxID=1202772 RepID=A0A1V9YK69_ACHHY|nr:hypothetical protein ACHHYP_10939 [Achlya hypogyna]